MILVRIPDSHPSIRSVRKLLRGWVRWVPSSIARVIYPSGTESCYIISSSAPWWIMLAPRGGPLPASMSGDYRCYNPSAFALLLVPLGTLSNRQIHEDLGVPLFADHIRALVESCDSKSADVENPLVRQLGRYLRWTRVDPVAWRESQGRQGPAGQSRPSPVMASRLNESRSALISRTPFGYPAEVFPWFFLTCKANARVHDAKSGHGPHSPPPGAAASPKRLKKVAYVQFATEPVWAQNPDSQPSKFYPSHN
jgi:hypothetical protein